MLDCAARKMTVAICRSTAIPFQIENTHFSPRTVSSCFPSHTPASHSDSEGPGHVDCLSKNKLQTPAAAVPYIHPLMQRTRPLMGQTSLDMCTESLGSETGSNDFDHHSFSMSSPYLAEDMTGQLEGSNAVINGRRDLLSSLNYHCTGKRSSPRSFPPPLPSISGHNGPCIRLRPHRCDSRLVVEAVLVPSQKFLQAHRNEGRLVLSFIESSFSHQFSSATMPSNKLQAQHQYAICEPENKNAGEDICQEDEDIDDEEDEEEVEDVEVVDRGTTVEVKLSRQPPQKTGAKKILQSSIEINKFVGGTPLRNNNLWLEPPALSLQRRVVPTTTTAAAVALAASSVRAPPEVARHSFPLTENKLLFITKRRNRERMLYNMQRCSELLRPLFLLGALLCYCLLRKFTIN